MSTDGQVKYQFHGIRYCFDIDWTAGDKQLLTLEKRFSAIEMATGDRVEWEKFIPGNELGKLIVAHPLDSHSFASIGPTAHNPQSGSWICSDRQAEEPKRRLLYSLAGNARGGGWSRDGRFLALATAEGRVGVWNKDGNPQWTAQVFPDGELVVFTVTGEIYKATPGALECLRYAIRFKAGHQAILKPNEFARRFLPRDTWDAYNKTAPANAHLQ